MHLLPQFMNELLQKERQFSCNIFKFTLHQKKKKTISVRTCNFAQFLFSKSFPPSKSNDRQLYVCTVINSCVYGKKCMCNSFITSIGNVLHQTAVKVLSECVLDYSSFKNIICLFLHFPPHTFRIYIPNIILNFRYLIAYIIVVWQFSFL